jgi:hypothetical protein
LYNLTVVERGTVIYTGEVEDNFNNPKNFEIAEFYTDTGKAYLV